MNNKYIVYIMGEDSDKKIELQSDNPIIINMTDEDIEVTCPIEKIEFNTKFGVINWDESFGGEND